MSWGFPPAARKPCTVTGNRKPAHSSCDHSGIPVLNASWTQRRTPRTSSPERVLKHPDGCRTSTARSLIRRQLGRRTPTSPWGHKLAPQEPAGGCAVCYGQGKTGNRQKSDHTRQSAAPCPRSHRGEHARLVDASLPPALRHTAMLLFLRCCRFCRCLKVDQDRT